MRFLEFSESDGRIMGINLDQVVRYMDNPKADSVEIQMVGGYTLLEGALGQIHLDGAGRRAFLDAIKS